MVVHFLNGVIQSNRVDSIFQNLTNSKSYNYFELDYVGNISLTMNSIDDSVAKVFKQEELSNKEVVRRVYRLYSIKK